MIVWNVLVYRHLKNSNLFWITFWSIAWRSMTSWPKKKWMPIFQLIYSMMQFARVNLTGFQSVSKLEDKSSRNLRDQITGIQWMLWLHQSYLEMERKQLLLISNVASHILRKHVPITMSVLQLYWSRLLLFLVDNIRFQINNIYF